VSFDHLEADIVFTFLQF